MEMSEMVDEKRDDQDAQESLGEKGFEKAKMHLDALKSLLDSKGLDVGEFVEQYAGESGPGDLMGAEEEESEGEPSIDPGKKMAIILALKKKMA